MSEHASADNQATAQAGVRAYKQVAACVHSHDQVAVVLDEQRHRRGAAAAAGVAGPEGAPSLVVCLAWQQSASAHMHGTSRAVR